MNSWINNLSFFICGMMLLLMVLGIVLAAIMPGIERWSRRFFLFLFAILALFVVTTFIDLVLYDNPGMARALRVIYFLQSLLGSIPVFIFTAYLLHCCKERWQSSSLFRVNLVLWIICFALLGIAQFTAVFYYVTPDNQFYRGPWYPLLLAPLDGIMVLNLIGVIRRRDRVSKKYFGAFLIYLLPLSAGLSVHTFIYTPVLVHCCIAISAFSMFGIILQDQADQYQQQQSEIARQQASIMVLQMRPHYIFNTMMVLYSLCGINPKKAQKVLLDFTTYLRKNFSAIASDHPIPFSDEIAHARAYLAVEEAKYKDDLLVDFDTPHTRFRVPPLTLQPIVENSVRHGMDPDSDEPLRITVRTRETDSGSEIIVEDTGSGFRPSGDNDPHIALENIRQRLDMMCGGKLVILSREGGGTIVKVTIPDSF